jgi:negative regulator of sigma E activity
MFVLSKLTAEGKLDMSDKPLNIANHPAYRNNLPLSAEQLSDLMDDRGDQQTLDQLLASNEQQAKTWYRYNLVSAVLNKQDSVHSSFEFSQMISDKIAKEPVLTSQKSAEVISFWKKATGGFAIAASVAFAMVFSVQMMNQAPQSLSGNNTIAEQNNALPSESGQTNVLMSSAEQTQLDDLQRTLDQINRNNFSLNEQLVGGEVMVQSFVVKTNAETTPFEDRIRLMKKPSEAKPLEDKSQ